MIEKPQINYTLEDWVVYWSPSPTNQTCQCRGPYYKCAPCVVKELDESWRRTLVAERASLIHIRNLYETLRKRVADALTGSPT